MVKVSVLPAGSLAVGVNEYAWPAATVAPAVPVMVGASGAAAGVTWIVNAGSDVICAPLSAEMTMPAYAPLCVVAGVPESWPVAVLKEAQAGGFLIEKVRGLPAGSLAAGVKAYA